MPFMVIITGVNYMKNQMYKVGMYGGSFDPLHIGHLHDVIRGASICEKLYVIVSWCIGRESTSKELRYRWLYNNCKHLDNVIILLLEDKAISKEVYNSDYYWEKGANDIKELVEEKIDAMIERKLKFAGEIIQSTGEKWITEMSNKELMELFTI